MAAVVRGPDQERVLEHAALGECRGDVLDALIHAGHHAEDHAFVAVVAGRRERQSIVLRHLQRGVRVLERHVQEERNGDVVVSDGVDSVTVVGVGAVGAVLSVGGLVVEPKVNWVGRLKRSGALDICIKIIIFNNNPSFLMQNPSVLIQNLSI